jgi:hypothetical protein
MKLGNKGFGMRDFLIYTCILVLLLLFVAYSINSFYRGMEASKKDKETQKVVIPEEEPEEEPIIVDYDYYHNLENDFQNATDRYFKNYPTKLDEGMIFKIELNDLVELKYLSQFRNKNTGDLCTGYSNVYTGVNDTGYTIVSYINCGEYVTEGYR